MTHNFENVNDARLVELASDPRDVVEKALVIDELARRAIENTVLLGEACAAIGRERSIVGRRDPPHGWLAACRLLNSRFPVAVLALLREMDNWTGEEQRDVIRLWAGRHRFIEATRSLCDVYGWMPKYVDG